MDLDSWLRGPSIPSVEHEQRMHRAAGVSSVQLICHADTWSNLDKFWGSFFIKANKVHRGNVKDLGGDLVEVTLSGPSLVMLLKLTRRRRFAIEERVIAKRVYEQVAKVIDEIDPEANPGKAIPPIVLDDKLGKTSAA
uniref:hypothetical protein n=1 Tax=Nocardia suismassiliense TaxID=2077092 RepID=UPI003F4954ED